jgi:polyhydroxybutyrate depolymerase
MTKRIPAFIIAVLIMLALSGCAPAEQPRPTASPTAQAAEPSPTAFTAAQADKPSPTASPAAQTTEPTLTDTPSGSLGADGYYSFDYNGTERKYLLYIPENIEADAPLVAVLHGYTGTAEQMMSGSVMDGLADKHGFAVVYPQGLPGKYGSDSYCWNADLTVTETDDIGFLVALVTYLQQTYDLNAKETFVCGFSNGGYMSYKLACDAPDTFRAVASVSGTMSGETWKNRDESVAVPILQIHGNGDDVVPVDGSKPLSGGWGGAPAMTEIIKYWADADNTHDLKTIKVSDTVTAYRYSSKENDNLVWYYEIEGYPHAWPKEKDAGFYAEDVIWEFFSNYVK